MGKLNICFSNYSQYMSRIVRIIVQKRNNNFIFVCSSPDCTHFTWTDYDGGTCWMKKNTVSKSDAFDSTDKSAVCGVMETNGSPSPPSSTSGKFLNNYALLYFIHIPKYHYHAIKDGKKLT